jgi:hypothetical protein
VLVAVWLGEDEKIWGMGDVQSALFDTTRVFLWPHGRRGFYRREGINVTCFPKFPQNHRAVHALLFCLSFLPVRPHKRCCCLFSASCSCQISPIRTDPAFFPLNSSIFLLCPQLCINFPPNSAQFLKAPASFISFLPPTIPSTPPRTPRS